MAVYQDLPAELREQIIAFALPKNIDLIKPFPQTLLSLLQTCKQTRSDVDNARQLLSLTVTIPQPSDLPRLASLTKLVRVTTIHLQLYYHSPILKDKNYITRTGDDGILDAWIPHIPAIPLPASVHTFLLDLTPAPQWLLEKRPDWLASHLNDRRISIQFMRDCIVPGAVRFLALLRTACAPNIEIEVTGQFAQRSLWHLERLMSEAQRTMPTTSLPPLKLTASFIANPRDYGAANGLSLFHTAHALGLNQYRKPEVWRTRRLQHGAVANLEVVTWTTMAHSLYHTNALEDEGRARRILVSLLGLAARRASGEAGGEINFGPTGDNWRKLIHNLCRGLDLCSSSDCTHDPKTIRAYF